MWCYLWENLLLLSQKDESCNKIRDWAGLKLDLILHTIVALLWSTLECLYIYLSPSFSLDSGPQLFWSSPPTSQFLRILSTPVSFSAATLSFVVWLSVCFLIGKYVREEKSEQMSCLPSWVSFLSGIFTWTFILFCPVFLVIHNEGADLKQVTPPMSRINITYYLFNKSVNERWPFKSIHVTS